MQLALAMGQQSGKPGAKKTARPEVARLNLPEESAGQAFDRHVTDATKKAPPPGSDTYVTLC